MYVHYVGTLTDGDKFDSSRDRGDRFSFNLGKSEVIKGWDQGVATMKLGEKAMFTIKPDYGYGSAGSPPKIPGKAWRVVLQKGPSEDRNHGEGPYYGLLLVESGYYRFHI